MLEDFIIKNRSYRRFDETIEVGIETLRDLVDLTRLAASGANIQPLRYVLVADADARARVFPNLSWAGYLKDWSGPVEGERPTGYIIIMSEDRLPAMSVHDPGIAAQTILMEAVTRGLGGCMIASVDHDGLKQALDIPDECAIIFVIALGQPAESIIVEPVGEDGDIRYYRDEDGVHHVPKRSLKDIIAMEFP